MLPLSVAAIGLADELLRLPAAAATTAVQLLYGGETALPAPFLAAAGRGIQLPLVTLLAMPGPLATVLPSRVRLAGSWGDETAALKGARMLARTRYRQLQAAFVVGAPRLRPGAEAALVRSTYGVAAGHGGWSEAARRISDRVTMLNRATLALVAPAADAARRALSPAAVEAVAGALLPLAVPDFARMGAALAAEPAPGPDEAVDRYQSLFAEMLALTREGETS
jgi:hypothetical protein